MSLEKPLIKTQVAIMGAGLVGMVAAVAMHQAGFEVLLIDGKNPEQALSNSSEEWDQKIYAVSPKNVEWLKQLGVWQHIEESRIGNMQHMQIWGDEKTPLCLTAEDANQDALAFIVEAKVLSKALLRQVHHHKIQTKFDCPGQQLFINSKKTLLELESATVDSELLLAADGSHSWVRHQINAPLNVKSYGQIAIVANFEVEESHGNTATQWFGHDVNGENSILAWLPLPGNRISIVWSVSVSVGQALLGLNAEEFTQRVSATGNHILGKMRLITSPASFPLSLQTTDVLTQDCTVFIGDAAHQIHPLAGQGMNLGFRDVIDIVEIWKDKNPYQSVNDSSLLKRYSRVRKQDVLNMRLLTDGLYQLFANQYIPIKQLRNRGLALAANSIMKKLLVEKAVSL